MFWIALAAQLSASQLSAPTPVKLETWFSPSDMPAYLEHDDGIWIVGVRVVIRPDGTLKSCEIESTSNQASLDVYTCRLLNGRAKYKPALTLDGTPSYGADREFFRWAVSSTPTELPRPADMDLSVEKLPEGLKSPVYVPVMFVTDEKGSISSCIFDSRRPMKKTSDNAALVAAACQQVSRTLPLRPVTNDAGVAVSAVQNALVRFATSK
jgi:hypothetical protein